MDRELIERFREVINESASVYPTYINYEGKNQWNIICSAMDWIDVVVSSITFDRIERNGGLESSIRVMTVISCIDVLWEAIQQLHRVFYHTKEIPFVEDSSVFKNKICDTTDNLYFKTIRACFAAHPVTLRDYFEDNKKENRYASWSGGFIGSRGDFAVILYSNEIEKQDITMHLSFAELMMFAQKRYGYLQTLITEIENQDTAYMENWKKQKIVWIDDPLEEILVLMEEATKRNYDFVKDHLMELKVIFETEISNPVNQKIVDQYRTALIPEIRLIYEILQDMGDAGKLHEQRIDDSYPYQCGYDYAKLSDAVFGLGASWRFNQAVFEESLKSVVDLSYYTSIEELYVVVRAGFYAYNRREKPYLVS